MRAGDILASASRGGMRGLVWSWHDAQCFAYVSAPKGLESWASADAVLPSIAISTTVTRAFRTEADCTISSWRNRAVSRPPPEAGRP